MEKKNNKIHDGNILGVTLQFIVTIFVVVMGVLSLFFDDIFPIFEIIMAVDLFLMAYNNVKIYKQAHLTIIYIAVGIFLIITSVLGIIGVI